MKTLILLGLGVTILLIWANRTREPEYKRMSHRWLRNFRAAEGAELAEEPTIVAPKKHAEPEPGPSGSAMGAFTRPVGN